MQLTKSSHRINCRFNDISIYRGSYDEQIEKDYNTHEQFFGAGSSYLSKLERQSTKQMHENYKWGDSDEDEDKTVITVRTV
jgi:hypothetical protein